uniref:Uncharacterized protein n=1 Tax=Parascaris equorum TaxID=6256 RepID=A0A914RKR8_PAREQ
AIADARNGQLGEDVCIVEDGNIQNAGHSLDGDVDMSRQKSTIGRRMNRAVSVKTVADSAHGICVHDHEITFNEKKDSAIATVAWMIIFGDGLHNFIDGISIGAAFSESLLSGISVAMAVLAEDWQIQMPEMKRTMEEALAVSRRDAFLVLSLQTIGLTLGTLSMFFFARYGDIISIE